MVKANDARNWPSAYMLKLCSAPEAITHHIVGIDNTVQYGEPVRCFAPTACSSSMPRWGSKIASAAIAHRIPGTPATKNVTRQPYAWASRPPMPADSPSPIGRPSMNTDIARARLVVG